MLVTVSDSDLTQYVNETNWSVKRLADVLFEKTGNGSWVVVFKALITVHHLMVYGNEVSMVYIHMVVISFLLILKISVDNCEVFLVWQRLITFYLKL